MNERYESLSDSTIVHRIATLDPELRGSLIYALDIYLDVADGELSITHKLSGEEVWTSIDHIDTERVRRFFEVLSGQREPHQELPGETMHSRKV